MPTCTITSLFSGTARKVRFAPLRGKGLWRRGCSGCGIGWRLSREKDCATVAQSFVAAGAGLGGDYRGWKFSKLSYDNPLQWVRDWVAAETTVPVRNRFPVVAAWNHGVSGVPAWNPTRLQAATEWYLIARVHFGKVAACNHLPAVAACNYREKEVAI